MVLVCVCTHTCAFFNKKVLAALPEDSNSVPSTHIRKFTTTHNSNFKELSITTIHPNTKLVRGVVALNFNPSTQEQRKVNSCKDRDQPGLQSEVQASQDYTVIPCLKDINKVKLPHLIKPKYQLHN